MGAFKIGGLREGLEEGEKGRLLLDIQWEVENEISGV